MWIRRVLLGLVAYLGAYLLVFLGSLGTVYLWTEVEVTWAGVVPVVARKSAIFAVALGTVFLVVLAARGRALRKQGSSGSNNLTGNSK